MTASQLNTIERVCTEIARDQRRITIAAVAATTGISRSTIYRNPALRAAIERHQYAERDQPLTALSDEIATLRAAVNTLADRVRKHDEQLRHMNQN